MEYIELLAEERVPTAAGLMLLSLASHDDGTYSVVARLLPTGRRAGYLRCSPSQHRTATVLLDSTVATTALEAAMRRLLRTAADARRTGLRGLGFVPQHPFVQPAPARRESLPL